MINELYKNIVIIGGNASGLAAASQARRINPGLNITVLEAGEYISYGSCGLPYFISGEIQNINDLFTYSPGFFEEKRNIKIFTGHKVIDLNPSKKELSVNININKSSNYTNNQQNEIFNYDKLIICSGSSPITLNIPGINSKNVFNFRNISDALSLKNFITQNNPKKALIVGGGSVGLLVGETLNKLGLRIIIIENSKKIFKDYDDEISSILSERVKASGVDILTENKIVSINNRLGEKAYSVSVANEAGDVKNSNEIETDLIVLAAGIVANTDFLSRTSIELGENRAIKVTNKQQTSYPNIYAAGDCCLVKNLVTQKNEFIPTAGTAIKTGRIAGSNAAGGDESFKGSLGTKVDKIFDFEIAKTGIGSKEALEIGFNVLKLTDSYSSYVKALPGVSNITIAITVDKKTGRLLGSQMIGKEGVGKRIDIFAAAISNEMKVNDIYMLDLSYAPKISTAIDPVNNICGKAMLELQKLNPNLN